MLNDFDIAASQYDIAFTFSNIGKAQRRLVFKYLKPIIQSKTKHSILELNCGTGEDAIQFAKLGHNVLATDISEGMISMAKAKTYSENLSFKTQDITTIDNSTFNEEFDFIFSNFGGFNCLSKTEIEAFFKKATHLLKPDGKIVLVVMPKHCLWEQLYFWLKGQPKKAKRRKSDTSVLANVDGVAVKTWYYNPKDIAMLATKNFSVENVKPIGLAIPPSYLENSIVSKPPFLSIFKGVDSLFKGAFLAKYADHFYIELTKNNS